MSNNYQRMLDYYPLGIRTRLEEIYSTYGDTCLIKPKILRKFGRTANADDGVKTTIMSLSGTEVHETLLSANGLDAVVSSSASDTEIISVEGHYLDSDNNFVFSAQEVTLTGQTPVTLTTALARCTRMYVKNQTFASPASDLVGTIYAYASDGVTVTSGVPQTDTAVKAIIPAGSNQTDKAQTTISYQDYWLITRVSAGLLRNNSNATADIEVEIKNQGGVWRPAGFELALRSGGSQFQQFDLDIPLLIPKNSDVRMVGTSNAANTIISGAMLGYLAKIY